MKWERVQPTSGRDRPHVIHVVPSEEYDLPALEAIVHHHPDCSWAYYSNPGAVKTPVFEEGFEWHCPMQHEINNVGWETTFGVGSLLEPEPRGGYPPIEPGWYLVTVWWEWDSGGIQHSGEMDGGVEVVRLQEES